MAPVASDLTLPPPYDAIATTASSDVAYHYECVPRAWSPDGKSLLVEFWNWVDPPHTHNFATLALEVESSVPMATGALTLLPAASVPAVLSSGHAYDF